MSYSEKDWQFGGEGHNVHSKTMVTAPETTVNEKTAAQAFRDLSEALSDLIVAPLLLRMTRFVIWLNTGIEWAIRQLTGKKR